MRLSPHPRWVDDLNATLEPMQEAILMTPVIEDAAANCLDRDRIQHFLVSFYPVIRDFPYWLSVLLERSPDGGREFFVENMRVERRHEAMWRAMGDAFGVPRDRFGEPEPPVLEVEAFHEFLTATCREAPFGRAVSATNYAIEGVAQKISAKALQGLSKNEKIGPKGRWWLEEHAKLRRRASGAGARDRKAVRRGWRVPGRRDARGVQEPGVDARSDGGGV